ncbi:hypothetical protein [Clostridium sp. JS66]|uniref:hypothetical protein n=1 Tax=Clostridium sp. JS66 TaxID=3064705 RepID=UPI00298EA809|nr:hypothetical protein [Clostridium sp. JS66]WPC42768.1 hypothetical protein Q6H37_04675 [Clostridium sp. JS66]
MSEILCIMQKEYWEIKSMGKKELIMIFIVSFLPLILLFKCPHSLLPKNTLAIFFPLVVSFVISGQLGFYSVLKEKKEKTLEVLLCSKVSIFSIVLGKILLPAIIGYVLSIFSIVCLKFGLLFINPADRVEINDLVLLLSIIISYAGCSISMLSTLLFPDEKVAPIISGIFMFVLAIIIYEISKTFGFSIFITFCCLISICIISTFIDVWILKNRKSFIFN